MKGLPFSMTLVYLGFFALIGVSVYFTKSAFPLVALLLAPTYKSDK